MLKSLNTLYKDQLSKVWTDAARQAALEARQARRVSEKDPKRLVFQIKARRRLMDRTDKERERLGMKPQFKEE